MPLSKLYEAIRERALCKHEKCAIGKVLCCPQQPASYYHFPICGKIKFGFSPLLIHQPLRNQSSIGSVTVVN